jgi:hypothetical protein
MVLILQVGWGSRADRSIALVVWSCRLVATVCAGAFFGQPAKCVSLIGRASPYLSIVPHYAVRPTFLLLQPRSRGAFIALARAVQKAPSRMTGPLLDVPPLAGNAL